MIGRLLRKLMPRNLPRIRFQPEEPHIESLETSASVLASPLFMSWPLWYTRPAWPVASPYCFLTYAGAPI